MTYQLHLGDCLEVMASLAPSSIDAVICDPPFGQTKASWDKALSLPDLWKQLKRVVKPHGAIVLFGVQPFTSKLVMSHLAGYKHRWVWCKNQGGNFAVARYMPLTIDEDILVFTRKGERVNYYPVMVTGKMRIKGGKNSAKNGRGFGGLKNVSYPSDQYYPKSILHFAGVPRTKSLHESQKPVPLMEYLVSTYTQEGDTVLDFAMGSGSTGIATLNKNRCFVGCDNHPDIFAIAQSRIGVQDESEA